MPPWGDVLSANEIEALWVTSRAGEHNELFGLFASVLGSLVLISRWPRPPSRWGFVSIAMRRRFPSSVASRIGGFDLALAQAIAEKLGRALSVQWFEAEDQPEKGKDTKTGIAALLADKRCDLAGAYPLLTIASQVIDGARASAQVSGPNAHDRGGPSR